MTLREYIRKLIEDEIELDVDDLGEASTTGGVAGYNIPSAFKRSQGTDPNDEPDDYHTAKINTATGYKKIQENRWHDLRKDESTPRQKIGKGITGIKRNVNEIETFLGWYSKIKEENGMKREDYWKKTQTDLKKIRERINKIALKLEQL